MSYSELRAAERALAVADRHAAVEGVDQAPVPQRGVGVVAGLLAERGERRERVDEAVDRAALAAHDVVDGAAVEQRGLRHVRRARAVARQRREAAAGRAVLVVDLRVRRAVDAVAGGAAVGVLHAEALALLVVDERLAEPGLDRVADEELLVRAREHRPGVRVVGEFERASCVRRRSEDLRLCVTVSSLRPSSEPVDEPDEVTALAVERTGHVGAVALHARAC